MRQLLKAALHALPFKSGLLVMAAQLPPTLKGRWSDRLFGAIRGATGAAEGQRVVTNLGLANDLRIRLPYSASSVLLFATPEQFIGERAALALAIELAGHARGFVDVGAHFGYFTFAVAARHGPRLPIHYFEPNPELFAIIDSNVRENGLAQVTGHQVAIGQHNGTARFCVCIDDSSLSSLEPGLMEGRPARFVEVEIVQFNSFADHYGLRDLVVKVDIENAEFQFLEGVGQAGDRITHLIIEVLGPAIGDGFVTEAAARLGMEPFYINDYRLEYAPGGKFHYVSPQYNWLFTRSSPQYLAGVLRGTCFTVVDAEQRH